MRRLSKQNSSSSCLRSNRRARVRPMLELLEDRLTPTVNNVAPSLTLDPVNAIVEGSVATLTGTITDPGVHDTFTLLVNWGDPASPNNVETYTFPASVTGSQDFTLTHQYLDDNPTGTPNDKYTISVNVRDADGASSQGAPELLVSSYNNHKVLRYDPDTGEFLGELVTAASGGLGYPTAIAIDANGYFYVGDATSPGHYEVLRYDPAGVFVDVFVPPGSGGLFYPHSLTFGPNGDLFVSSYGTDEVLRYRGSDGAFLGAFVTAGSGGLSGPTQSMFGPDGNFYVLCWNAGPVANSVLRYDGDTGEFLDTFVSPGSGGLWGPHGMVFGADNDLFVVSYFNSRVLRYSATTGEFLGTVLFSGTPIGINFAPNGELYVASQASNSINRFDPATGQFLGAITGGGLQGPTYFTIAPTGWTTTSVIVANVDVTFEAGADETLLPPQAGAFSRSGITITDPGTLDVHTVKVDYDGDSVIDETINVPLGARTFDLAHTYTADGIYTVSVTVQDDDGNPVSDTFQVTVILNTPPVAVDDSVSTDEDHAFTFNVVSNDEDDQNNIVAGQTIALTTPAVGILTNNGDGTFAFDPAGAFDYLAVGESAQVTFDYQIEDSFGETNTGTVTITVHGVNDDPTIGVDEAEVTVNEGDTATNSGTFGDIDLSDVVSVMASIGTVTQDNGAWTWSFNATDGPTESQTVTITADDGQGGIVTTTFDLVVNNVAPTVSLSGPTGAVRGQTVTYSGSFTDSGADTHTSSWQVFDSGNVVVVSGSGLSFAFTPTASGDYTVRFTVTDDDGGVGSASQTLSVAAVALLIDTCDPTKTMLVVGGTLGDDDIVLSPSGSGGDVAVTINGVSQGTFSPTGRLVVYAQAGNDNVQIAGSITNSARLFGGGGSDRLKGGNGHDVLLGGDGDDLVIGGQGRDLLIGGLGSDRIVGNADEDILIAGSTAHDNFEHALCSLMDEWTSGSDYGTRVANITAGTGVTNGFRLDGADGANQTVFEDNSADVLTGSQGQDWFFANRLADNGGVLDTITDRAANELWLDTDF